MYKILDALLGTIGSWCLKINLNPNKIPNEKQTIKLLKNWMDILIDQWNQNCSLNLPKKKTIVLNVEKDKY